MACCTETIRCEEARRLAEQYYDVKHSRMQETPKRVRLQELKEAYTAHLYHAGLIAYGTTAVPTDPDTW